MTILDANSIALILAAILAGMIVPQAALTLWFVRTVRNRMQKPRDEACMRDAATTVPAEVVLCLRGCDATLGDVFSALASQRHSDWRLRVVVDSETDPAWAVAQAAIANHASNGASWREATIEALAERPVTGSLKCASLRQAFTSLDSRTLVVALVDADSVVQRDWLVTLVDETMHPGTGAVSGNRWYAPVHDSIAGTVRLVWNAGALVQMSAFGIPWGGSLAVRREAMEACRWTEVIRTTLCEDTALAGPLSRAGWQYRFVPALIAVDEDDDVTLGPLTRWIARQLLTVRLHHPSWFLVAVHGLGTTCALVAGVSIAGIAAARGSWTAFMIATGAVAMYEMTSGVLLLMIASTARSTVIAAGRSLRPLSLGQAMWLVAMIPLTQAVYAIASLTAATTRSIEWRGITYDITRLEGRPGVRVRSGLSPHHDTARAAEGTPG